MRKNGVEAVFLVSVLKRPRNRRWKPSDAKGHSSATSASIFFVVIFNSTSPEPFCQMVFKDQKNVRHGMAGAVAALHPLDSNL